MFPATLYGVPVVFRSTWNTPEEAERLRNQGKRPIAYSSGKLAEFVTVIDPATGEPDKWSVAESLNGELAPGGSYDLDVELTVSRDGNRTVRKFKVVGAKRVGQAPVAAKAA